MSKQHFSRNWSKSLKSMLELHKSVMKYNHVRKSENGCFTLIQLCISRRNPGCWWTKSGNSRLWTKNAFNSETKLYNFCEKGKSQVRLIWIKERDRKTSDWQYFTLKVRISKMQKRWWVVNKKKPTMLTCWKEKYYSKKGVSMKHWNVLWEPNLN